MKSEEERLEELIEQGWIEAGEIESPTGGTTYLYASPDGKGQAEYNPDDGLNITA
jgi:hypothetical protein